MAYIKAEQVLPTELLNQIQKYIDGEYIYVPKKECNKKEWGQISKTKEKTIKRNNDIYTKYQNGWTVKELSEYFYLSDKTIYSIISKFKYRQ